MISISIPCTLSLLTLAALLLSSALCIKSAPSLPSFAPASHECPPASLLSSCSVPPSPSRWLPFITNLSDMSLPALFNPLTPCLFLRTNFSSSSPFFITFTIALTDELLPDSPPGLAFALFRPQVLSPFIEITFNFSIRDSCSDASSLLSTCKARIPQNITSPHCNRSADHSDREKAGLYFNYSASLEHNASSASLLVQAEVNYGGGFDIKQTFTLNSTDLHPDPDDTYRELQDDSIALFVYYVAGGEATINISKSTIINDHAASPSINCSDSIPPHQNHSKSNHTTVVLWVVVGVSMVAFAVGVMILALAIKKRYRGRPPLVRSHLAGKHVTPPSTTTTRAPFPHPHRESSATPMMATLCLSPPYNVDNFQMSGMASWLNQPNPR